MTRYLVKPRDKIPNEIPNKITRNLNKSPQSIPEAVESKPGTYINIYKYKYIYK